MRLLRLWEGAMCWGERSRNLGMFDKRYDPYACLHAGPAAKAER